MQLSIAETVPEPIEFVAKGTPVPQGSHSVKMVRGKPILIDRADMQTKTQPSGRLTRWRTIVGWAARRAMEGRRPFACAVALDVEFVIKRPSSHYTSKGALTSSAPPYPGKPDLSKLIRAVEDAMTGIVYADDAQVVCYRGIRKRYGAAGGTAGARIRIEAYAETA